MICAPQAAHHAKLLPRTCRITVRFMLAYMLHGRLTHPAGFPKLYFKDPITGTYESVGDGGKLFPSKICDWILTPHAGLLVYYLNRGNLDKSNGGPGLTAFPPGFKMISGSAASRSIGPGAGTDTQAELAQAAIQYSCLRYTSTTSGYNGLWSSIRSLIHIISSNMIQVTGSLTLPARLDLMLGSSSPHVGTVLYAS